MNNLPATKVSAEVIEKVLIQGDLSKLSSPERVSYYNNVCSSMGLNPLTKPFDYISLNGKLVLYAKRDATDQLRKVHNVSITISSREKIDDVYVVTAKARNADGREDESTGAVNVANLKGESLANAMMKAETKAKRRVTLSICGLGMLDETEVETIESAEVHKPTPFDKIAEEKEAKKLDFGLFEIRFGKYKGKLLNELDVFELNNYVQWIKDSAAKQNKPLTGVYKDLVESAEAYLTTKETGDSIVDAAREAMNAEVVP